jgi:hypothetical protein
MSKQSVLAEIQSFARKFHPSPAVREVEAALRDNPLGKVGELRIPKPKSEGEEKPARDPRAGVVEWVAGDPGAVRDWD